VEKQKLHHFNILMSTELNADTCARSLQDNLLKKTLSGFGATPLNGQTTECPWMDKT
jgi:cytochrome c5